MNRGGDLQIFFRFRSVERVGKLVVTLPHEENAFCSMKIDRFSLAHFQFISSVTQLVESAYSTVMCFCKIELLLIKSTRMHQIMGFQYGEFDEAVELAEK